MPQSGTRDLPEPPVVAEVVRSGVVESRHHGSVVALRPDGSVEWSVGDVSSPILPRSCNKPLQALGMVRLGLDLPPDLLALACASHSGEPFHADGVRRILAGAGLDESALLTPAELPIVDEVAHEVLRSGGGPAPILMNCSGKHAAMLATCVLRGWPTDTYLDPAHPLQEALRATFAEMTGEPAAALAVDGCGAPIFPASLTGLARAFGRLARGLDGRDEGDPASARVAAAVREHPEQVSGSTRDEARLIRAVPGAITKAGAEGCQALGLSDGRAFALKIADGARRARPVVMAAALARSGVDRMEGVDADAVRETGSAILTGGGRPVGGIRPCWPDAVC